MTVQRYVVVGGVAGGMSAAARLRRLDEQAEIIVFEQGGEVSYASCGLPYFVGGEITEPADLLVQTPASLRAWLNLDVRVNHQVLRFDAMAKILRVAGPNGEEDVRYDHLILSPGTIAARPPIPGLDHRLVHTLRTVPDALALRQLVADGAKQAVVLGAGFIGLEAAEGLRRQGLEVALVEAMPHVLPPLEPELAWLVRQELIRLGIEVHEAVAASRIDDANGRAAVQLTDGTVITADLVVLSVGVRPNTAAFATCGVATDDRGAILVDQSGRTNLPDVWAVGDAVASLDAITGVARSVALAGPANRAGRLVADAITHARRSRPLPALLSTAIVRVGDLTVAMTGANRASLTTAGQPFATLHTHSLNHAGYFPGGSQIHLVVQLHNQTGVLLGAQAVGQAGVDKRIDVLATAIRAGLLAPDLIDLDLSYSPPYGSAKDPITMIGLLADNVLTGQTALWYPEELDQVRAKSCLLDVRTPAEFATGHLPEAVNIPHTELRARLDDVKAAAAGRPIAVLCQSGVRSYIAHRVLVANGFSSRTLSGGMLTLRAWLGDQAATTLITGESS